AEDGIRDLIVTGVQTCALPISSPTTSATTTRTELRAERLQAEAAVVLVACGDDAERVARRPLAQAETDRVGERAREEPFDAADRSEERRVGKECRYAMTQEEEK